MDTPAVDGWAVGANPVKVVHVQALAADEANPLAGINVLALHHGSLMRTLPTVAGRKYTLSFMNHGRPVDGPVGWWKGEGKSCGFDGQQQYCHPFNSPTFCTRRIEGVQFQRGRALSCK